MRIRAVGLCLGAVLLMMSQASAGRQNPDPEIRAIADSFGRELILEWDGVRDSSNIRKLLGGVQEFGPPSGGIQAGLVPVFAGVVDDTDRFAEITQYLAVTQLGHWHLESADAESVFWRGLANTSRDLPRLASAVALVKSGRVQEVLSVVEEYARNGWKYTDTLDTTHWVLEDDYDPVAPFWPGWHATDPVDDDSLNAYMVRVLSYPFESRRIAAIIILLEKGVAIDQALDAAQIIVENPEPCFDGETEYADQLNLVYILGKDGGARGRSVAAMYRK